MRHDRSSAYDGFTLLDSLVEIARITTVYASEIGAWRYDPPLDCYDMTAVDASVLAQPDSGFYPLLDGADLIGFRSFGPDGQVPGGSYDTEALDTGGGLRPDLVGHGLGREAIETGLSFGRSMFAPNAFRVTVANFNTRPLRVVESVGFRPVTHFAATNSGREYTVLLRPES
jgi:RimJ/RimL family protein N-acetyltransferase